MTNWLELGRAHENRLMLGLLIRGLVLIEAGGLDLGAKPVCATATSEPAAPLPAGEGQHAARMTVPGEVQARVDALARLYELEPHQIVVYAMNAGIAASLAAAAKDR